MQGINDRQHKSKRSIIDNTNNLMSKYQITPKITTKVRME